MNLDQYIHEYTQNNITKPFAQEARPMKREELRALAAEDIADFGKLRVYQQRRILRAVHRQIRPMGRGFRRFPKTASRWKSDAVEDMKRDTVGIAIISIIGAALLSFIVQKLAEWFWNRIHRGEPV